MNEGKNRRSMVVQNQILLLYERGYSLRSISGCLDVSRNTIRRFVREKKSLKVQEVFQEESSLLVSDPPNRVSQDSEGSDSETEFKEKKLPKWLSVNDFEWVEKEWQKGVAFKTLYNELNPPVTYWSFWRRVHDLLGQKSPKISVRLTHQPAEKVQVDLRKG